LLLERRGRTWQCARRHSYDVARSGYLNLLQPQDRRSSNPGDSAEAVEARARLIGAGIGRSILDGIVHALARLASLRDVVVDLGSGTGDALGSLQEHIGMTGIGIDISTAAAEHASRRFPPITWIVANADRRLPLLDGCVDVILSMHGRRNVAECARVLTPAGRLLVAVPAADDLIELRELVLGEGIARERTEALVAEHVPRFSLSQRFALRERHHLSAAALADLLRSTYRGERRAELHKLDGVSSLDVTLASDVLILERSGGD
jgi:23S rRNA (guanine745-N1)-methyltransferase